MNMMDMSHLSQKDVNRVKSYIRQQWSKVDSIGSNDRYFLLQHIVWLASQGFNTVTDKKGRVSFPSC